MPLFFGHGRLCAQARYPAHNEYYATIVFSRAVRWAVQLAFMCWAQYYPYDKWTHTFFERLPRHAPLGPLVAESVRLFTPWDKLELLNRIADVLDRYMVEDHILQPIPSSPNRPLPAIACSNMPTPRSSASCRPNCAA